MRIKLSKEEADFIKARFVCTDVSISGSDRIQQTYWTPFVCIQSSEVDKENDYFEIKHIADLSKEEAFEILRNILTKT